MAELREQLRQDLKDAMRARDGGNTGEGGFRHAALFASAARMRKADCMQNLPKVVAVSMLSASFSAMLAGTSLAQTEAQGTPPFDQDATPLTRGGGNFAAT